MSAPLDQFREIIQDKTSRQPPLSKIERFTKLSVEEFRNYAVNSTPVIMTQEAEGWPLLQMTVARMKDELGDHPVKARVGDYVSAAFSPQREFVTMPLSEYIDLISQEPSGSELPPYVGNNDLPAPLSKMVSPPHFYPVGAYNEPRLWLGPKGAVTALHYDFADNLFVQVWGTKQFIVYPPHDEPNLATWEASPVIKGSRIDPENPDYDQYPLSRLAKPLKCELGPGEMLFLPGLWFHHVRALQLSLSVNYFVGQIRPMAAFPPGTRW